MTAGDLVAARGGHGPAGTGLGTPGAGARR
jgi:hypothetical protein